MLALSVLIAWLAKPEWFSQRRVVYSIVLLTVAWITVMALGRASDDARRPASPQGTTFPNRVEHAADLLPEMTTSIVLFQDESGGELKVFRARLDGMQRQSLFFDAAEVIIWEAARLPGTDQVVASLSDRGSQSIGGRRLEIRGLDGNLVQVLTRADPNQSDSSPAIAGGVGTVYFIREAWRSIGADTAVPYSYALMALPLDGASTPNQLEVPAEFHEIASDDAGEVLAGECQYRGSSAVCLLETSEFSVLPNTENDAVLGAAVSPDGRYIAYASYKDNAFGESQIYIFDRATKASMPASRLPGVNLDPEWVPGAPFPCVLFSHEETGDRSIYLSCLTPELKEVRAIPVGHTPKWYGS